MATILPIDVWYVAVSALLAPIRFVLQDVAGAGGWLAKTLFYEAMHWASPSSLFFLN